MLETRNYYSKFLWYFIMQYAKRSANALPSAWAGSLLEEEATPSIFSPKNLWGLLIKSGFFNCSTSSKSRVSKALYGPAGGAPVRSQCRYGRSGMVDGCFLSLFCFLCSWYLWPAATTACYHVRDKIKNHISIIIEQNLHIVSALSSTHWLTLVWCIIRIMSISYLLFLTYYL